VHPVEPVIMREDSDKEIDQPPKKKLKLPLKQKEYKSEGLNVITNFKPECEEQEPSEEDFQAARDRLWKK